MSLRARLIFPLLLVVTLSFGLVLYSTWEQRRVTNLNLQETALRLARLFFTLQDEQIARTRQLLITLAQLPEVQGRDSQACSKLFGQLLADYPFYAGLTALGPDGYAFCGALPMEGPVYGGDRAYFRRAIETRGFVIGDYQIGRVTRKVSVNFSYPAFDPEGRLPLRAVVVAAVDLDWLSQLVAEARLPQGSAVMMVDSNGVILAHYPDPEKWTGEKAPEPLMAKILRALETDVAEAMGLDGRPSIFGFTPLLETEEAGNIYLSVGIPRPAAMGLSDGLLARNLAVMALIGLVGLLLAWRSTDRYTVAKTGQEEQATREEELRALAVRQQQAREDERASLAREIHDELSGNLTALKMDLSLLPDRAAKDRELLVEMIGSMSDLIDRTMARVQSIVTELRPVVLDRLGLIAAIEWQAREFQSRSGIRCELSLPREDLAVDRDRATAIFRILQEALTNVARHANASRVWISFGQRGDALTLEVRDNGKGISPEDIFSLKSLGLLGMRERTLAFGGQLHVEGGPGGGTSVTLRVPYKPA